MKFGEVSKIVNSIWSQFYI